MYLSLHAKYSHMPNMPLGRTSPSLHYVVKRPTVVHPSLAFHIFDISPLTAETLCEASGQYDHSDSLKSFSSDIQDHGCYSNTSNDIYSQAIICYDGMNGSMVIGNTRYWSNADTCM